MVSRYSKASVVGDVMGAVVLTDSGSERPERRVERARDGLVAGPQREGQRMCGGKRCDDQLDRFSGRVVVVLQLPALQPGAPIGHDRDNIAGFNADIALGGVSDQRVGEGCRGLDRSG